MEYTQIPGTGLKVSRIALGTWAIGGWMWGGTEEAESIRTIHAALDQGINLIDTASVYGFGRSEQIVGQALAQRKCRDQVFIATKTGLDWTDGKVFRNCTPDYLRQNFAASLKNLQTDYVDILYVHWPDPLEPFEATAQVMHEFLQAGKIKAVGVSNYSPEQIRAFQQGGPVHIVQPPYNLFERAIEAELMPFCYQENLHLMTYGALCRGLLSGKVTAGRSYEGDDLRNFDPKFKQPRLDQYLAAVQRLDALARGGVPSGRPPPGGALGPGPRRPHRPVGRPPSRPDGPGPRDHGLEPGSGGHGRDRRYPPGRHPGPGGPGIHGSPAPPAGLRPGVGEPPTPGGAAARGPGAFSAGGAPRPMIKAAL
jgi:aryl-alcohol dehydrogenase-like predicted oxidoreductase